MPTPSRPEAAAATSTTQQQPMNGMRRRGGVRGAMMRPANSRRPASSKMPSATKDTPPAPARVTAWFTSTAYDLGLASNPLVPIMEHGNAATRPDGVMAGEWAAHLSPAADTQANPPPAAENMPGHRAAAMMMLMDGSRMASGRPSKGDVLNKNEMGRTQYRHGAPPRAPPPMYKHQPMSRTQRTQMNSRTARSAMASRS